MGEKKLYLYMNDTEYGRKLQRYLNTNRHSRLRVEMVTERDTFWKGRQHMEVSDTYWFTDDLAGAADDRGDPCSLIVLDENTDEKRQRISCRIKAENLFMVLLSTMALEVEAKGDSSAPTHGIYGVYAPWGEEGSVVAALLSQGLAAHGETLYVNMKEFPVFYEKYTEDDTNLGELFFRIDSHDLDSVVKKTRKKYGAADRLPGVSHYRDLWDIDPDDIDRFFKRLLCDCGYKYVIVLFNDVRVALPMADLMTEVVFVRRDSGCTDPYERWKKYAGTEKTEGRVRTVIMPSDWDGWIFDMERKEPEKWLEDTEKREFIVGMSERT